MREPDTGTESGRLIKRRNLLRAGGFAAGITGAVGLEPFEATAESTERRGERWREPERPHVPL